MFLFLGFVIGYLPQILLLSIGQGRLAILPHTDQGFSLPYHFLGILIDSKLGLIFYMPIFIVGVAGLFLFYKKQKILALIFSGTILIEFLLVASWDGWHQAAYTMRYFINLLPLISFGIAELVAALFKRYSTAFIYFLIAALVLHQFLMIIGFKLFLQDPTNVGSELSRSGKLKIEIMQKLNLPFR